MKRSNILDALSHNDLASGRQKMAYHEAGHAAAIHFNNNSKNLPLVFFQIQLKKTQENSADNRLTNQRDHIAKINGGRLIQSVVANDFDHQSLYTDNWVSPYTDNYRLAFEADIVNLLMGSLAEAKYCAQIDDEPFNSQLLTVQALKNYGGEADLVVVNQYLQNYSANKEQQHENLKQFFIQAFNFVNTNANWKLISRLANYILTSNKHVISYAEVTSVLNGHQFF